MSEGTIYILTNPAMPGMVKIGQTDHDISKRLSDLYSTGVPLPFECAYAALVNDVEGWEKAFHRASALYRVNPRREFFDIKPDQAIALLKQMEAQDVTQTVKEEAENVDIEAKVSSQKLRRRRRPTSNFIEMGIPVGSKLYFNGPVSMAINSAPYAVNVVWILRVVNIFSLH